MIGLNGDNMEDYPKCYFLANKIVGYLHINIGTGKSLSYILTAILNHLMREKT